MPIRARFSEQGVTLIELMVGITITGVLLAIGVPSFQSTIASSRVTTTNNDFVSAMALARSEAIRRGTRITVCKSANGTACVTTGDWAQGWIVFVDTTRATTDAAVDTGEVIISRAQAGSAGVAIAGEAAVANFISFSADGAARNMAGASQQGRIRVCSTSTALDNARRARDITLAGTGRLATATPASVAATCPLT
ncbi:MAG: type IV fimbrial biogenesis protein FimT [Burkholderiales bacterium]|nr:MAG: type IV fimbrial biogenesis protein FimT [Burkholderiales bacterium]